MGDGLPGVMDRAARLRFEGIGRRFGDRWALRNINFDLHAGEVMCLLGPSGCGKSTTLRLAAGVERPDEGRICLDGQEIAGSETFVPPEKRHVGLMFQDFALFPHMSVIENVAFGLFNLASDQRRAEAMAVLDRMGMAAFAEKFPSVLSGGEQQRVALARALAPRPHVLLMDEPFSGLDDRLRDDVRAQTLELLRREGASVLLVTHDPAEAMQASDRIALMRDGRIVQLGAPTDLFDRPADAEAAAFFGPVSRMTLKRGGEAFLSPWGPLMTPNGPTGPLAELLLRPDMISVNGMGFPGRYSQEAPCQVRQIRHLGAESWVELEIGGAKALLQARLPGRAGFPVGAEASCRIDLDRLLLFPASG